MAGQVNNSINNRQSANGETEIDLLQIVRVIWKNLWIIILGGIAGGIIALAVTLFLIEPTYRSSFTAYVNNRTSSNQSTEMISNADTSASQQLTHTYAAIMTSRPIVEEAIEAAKKAHADIFIETLPKGYETVVSNKQGLSEGQRQMIAIARVMLLNPNLVILDEATSNIDTRSELLITEAFDLMMKEKTSIVIAHRLSTIEKADIIIVLKDGAVVETGNHQSLMKKQGFYYSLYSSQYK